MIFLSSRLSRPWILSRNIRLTFCNLFSVCIEFRCPFLKEFSKSRYQTCHFITLERERENKLQNYCSQFLKHAVIFPDLNIILYHSMLLSLREECRKYSFISLHDVFSDPHVYVEESPWKPAQIYRNKFVVSRAALYCRFLRVRHARARGRPSNYRDLLQRRVRSEQREDNVTFTEDKCDPICQRYLNSCVVCYLFDDIFFEIYR